MKKKLKAFTLIELIIVMAILTILMAAIMQMFKPIRTTYVDATFYEGQRTAQNGMVQYLTESLRYATNMGIYSDACGVSDAAGAVAKFKTLTNNEYADDQINVITIDNETEYKFNNKEDLYGRLLRSKSISANVPTNRIALGTAYYDSYTYSIRLEPSKMGNKFTGNLKITVASLLPSSLSDVNESNTIVKTGDVESGSYKIVKTEGSVSCKNLQSPINGKSDISCMSSDTTTAGQNTYIVFTLPKNN